MTTTRCYRNGELIAEGFPLEKVDEYLAEDQAIVWVDLLRPTPEQLETVAAELGLHTLAVEAAATQRQRPKFNRYQNHDFISAYAVRLDAETGELVTAEAAAFITPNALVTVHKDEHFPSESLLEHLDENVDLTVHGISALVYGLLDFVVDGHFDAVQELDDEIERLSEVLFEPQPHNGEVQRRSYELRRSLVQLRRVVLPMREVVNTIMRRDVNLVSPEMAPYYQDLYDHVLRAGEWTDSLRDLVSTIVETNLTIQGNRLNIITKKVTSWAAIIAVPTAITGFYGQNLPYPGFAHRSGYLTSTVLIVVLSLILYITFKRKDWL